MSHLTSGQLSIDEAVKGYKKRKKNYDISRVFLEDKCQELGFLITGLNPLMMNTKIA